MRKSPCIVALGGWDAWPSGEGTGRLLPHGETCGLLGMCQAFSYSWGGYPESPALCGREKELECSLGPFSPTLQNLNEKTEDQRGNIFPTTGIATLHLCWAELTLPDSNPHCQLLHLFSALSTSMKWVLWYFLRRLAVKMNWDTCPVQNPVLYWVWKISGRGHGNPLQFYRLENPMDRGTWWATVHQGHTESDTTEAI